MEVPDSRGMKLEALASMRLSSAYALLASGLMQEVWKESYPSTFTLWNELVLEQFAGRNLKKGTSKNLTHSLEQLDVDQSFFAVLKYLPDLAGWGSASTPFAWHFVDLKDKTRSSDWFHR